MGEVERIAYIGIDPGVTGAVAVINRRNETWIIDTPSLERTVSGKTRNDYDMRGMARAVKDAVAWTDYPFASYGIVIEEVGTMPTDGRVGAFSFGKGYGAWLGILSALGLTFDTVSPLVWKKEFGLLRQPKTASLSVARELFPEAAGQLKLLKHHNRAEALLLAEYGRRTALRSAGKETTAALRV